MLLTWAGCFSDVKRLDASGLAEDTSVRDAYQPNTWMDVKPSGDSPGDMDGTPGSGGRTGFDANSGDGAGGLHGTGGAGGLHGTGGAGGLVGSGGASSSVDAPLSSGGAGGGTGGSTGTGGGAGTDGAVVDGNKDAGLEVPPPPCQSAKDGTPCGEGMVCSNAQCVPCASGGSCPASNPCHRGIYSCSTGVSVCVDNGNAPDGTDCGSGNVCRSGTCSACVQGGECPLPNSPCRKGILTCTAGVSSCADNGAKPDLTTCDDGNACTTGEACHAGGCNGGTPKTCTASDSCHAAGTCDPATGACSNPVGNEGGACNDGNACSQTDKCQSGQCVGTNPVVCTALDACHGVGTCDTTTGACSNPVANENGTCTDGNACTQTDKCQNGQCVGTNPVVCAALDGCHVAGTCNTANGTCSNPIGNIGSACPLTDPCMKSGLCQSNGSCVGVTKCDSPENCHTAQGATCAAGVCNYPSFGEGATDSNCPPGRQICHSGICAQCINNTNCSGNANGPLCDTSTNNCVQCLSSADCTGSAKSCTPSTHQCVCRLPSDGNILKNPGFNEGSTWWNLEAATIDATYDADGCSGSSGIRTGGGPDPYQCVDVAGGTEFWMGGTFKGMATGYIRAQYYSATSCGGTELGSDQFMYYGAENWSPASGKYETPAAARSVRISISVTYLFCDRLYINTSADRF